MRTTLSRGLRATAVLAAVAAAGSLAVTSASAQTRGATPNASGNLFASVAADGTVLAGNGVVSASTSGFGQYEVTFDQDVSGCAYVSTTVNGGGEARQSYTAGGHASTSGVYVETKNQGGGLTPAPFQLVVDCGSTGTSYAVVGYRRNLIRSSTGVSVTPQGSGRYQVSFPSSVSRCAAVATVGDPGDGLVYGPAGVYTGRGSNARSVYVETKNTGGGLQNGVPFHLAVFCPSAAGVHAAVVGADGLSTTSFGALTFRSSTGQYTLVADSSLAGCATVVTRGSTDTSVPYAPSTVETTAGPAANTVGIQVRTLLQGGGTLDDQSFHVAAVC